MGEVQGTPASKVWVMDFLHRAIESGYIGGGDEPEQIPDIVSFSEGTDEQIIAMIRAYYNNILTLDEIKTVWYIGDKRKFHINAMEATGVSESHHADDYEFIIIGFDHDELTTPINGHTRALLTLNQDRILYKDTISTSYSSAYPASADEGGYMNGGLGNGGGWETCSRRTWCNAVYFEALPDIFKTEIKTVNKKTSVGGTDSTIGTTQDKVFLFSEIELFGTFANSFAGEGDQYEYLKNTSNAVIKYPIYSNRTTGVYWERSPYKSNVSQFCHVGASGTPNVGNSNNTLGISPCFCL